MSMLPTGRLVAENERLRERIEALERLAAESRLVEEARREIEERSRLGEADRRRREAEVLAQLTREINASIDLDTVLSKVTAGARALCASDMVGIAMREPDSGAMIFRHWRGIDGLVPRSVRVAEGTGVAARVLATGRPFRTDHYARDPRITRDHVDPADRQAITALMAVPIRIGDRIEGLIYVGNHAARPFADQDEGTILRLADHAGIAIQNARQLRHHQRRLDELSVLHEVGRAVTGGLAPGPLLVALHREIGRVLDAAHMLVLLRDAARRDFEIAFVARAAAAAADVPVLRVGDRLPPGVGLAGRAVERRECLRTSDYLEACRREGVEPALFAAGFPHAVAAPLIAGQDSVGALELWSPDRPFSGTDEQVLMRVGGLAALALGSARADDERQRERRRRRSLLRLVSAVTVAREPGEILAALRKAAGELVPGGTVRALGAGERLGGPAAAVAHTRSPVVQEGLVILPLVAGDRLLGVLSLAPSEPAALGAEDLEVLAALAALAAAALHRAGRSRAGAR